MLLWIEDFDKIIDNLNIIFKKVFELKKFN